MHRSALITAMLMTGIFPAMAQEVPPAPKPAAPDIIRSFSVDEIQSLSVLCNLAIWANRIGTEAYCNALKQKMSRTVDDDIKPQPDGK